MVADMIQDSSEFFLSFGHLASQGRMMLLHRTPLTFLIL